MKLPLSNNSSHHFQTPQYAAEPLLPLLHKSDLIWECACGKGNLVKAFQKHGYQVVGTDILEGKNFLTSEQSCDVIITNPPYDLKDQFLERCYALGKPFALLMPLTGLEGIKRQKYYREKGIQLILFPKRINFETPSGIGSGSWFASAWFTWGLTDKELTFWTTTPKSTPVRQQEGLGQVFYD